MARTIPVAGEPYLGDDPAVMKVLKVTFGDSDQDVSIQIADSGGIIATSLVNLPYGIHVHDVGWRVITAFNGGTDLLLGVDCSSDCDYFANDSDIACSVANAAMRTTKSFAVSKVVDSWPLAGTGCLGLAGFTPDSDGNNLQAFVTKSDTALDSGVLEVYVYYHAAVTV